MPFFFHWYVYVPGFDGPLSTTLPPEQNVVGPFGVIDGDGRGNTVTVAKVEAAQPPAFAVVTVYVPLTPTVIDCVVAPLDHR